MVLKITMYQNCKDIMQAQIDKLEQVRQRHRQARQGNSTEAHGLLKVLLLVNVKVPHYDTTPTLIGAVVMFELFFFTFCAVWYGHAGLFLEVAWQVGNNCSVPRLEQQECGVRHLYSVETLGNAKVPRHDIAATFTGAVIAFKRF